MQAWSDSRRFGLPTKAGGLRGALRNGESSPGEPLMYGETEPPHGPCLARDDVAARPSVRAYPFHQSYPGLPDARWPSGVAGHLLGGDIMATALADKTCTPCRGGVPPLTPKEAEGYLV